jgi:hypothetical protein
MTTAPPLPPTSAPATSAPATSPPATSPPATSPPATSPPATRPDGTPPLEFAALRATLAGDLVLPDEPDWDRARAAWHLTVDQRPAAVVAAAHVDDVVSVMRHAAATGLRVAAQSTGHGAPALEELSDTILLRTRRMDGVAVDPVRRRARVEAGALWQDLVPLAAEYGLAALHGSAPDIGIVGYSLGGGVGWLARRYGFACNSVLAAEIVTPQGERLRATADSHPELFWALRGGGGSFGVVTALEFALYPITEVHAGVLFFPIDRAREVLHAWRDWTDEVPDTVTSVGRLLRFPPVPDLPEPLRGRSFVVVEACMLMDEPTASTWLRPLRELRPEMDTFATGPVTRLPELHMDPPTPVPALVDHRLLAAAVPGTIDALVDACGPRVDSPLLSVEIRHLGGALDRPHPDHGVLDRLDAHFAVVGVGMPVTPEHGIAIEEHLGQVGRSVAPWCLEREFLNFAERPTTPERLFGAQAAARLAQVAATYDP